MVKPVLLAGVLVALVATTSMADITAVSWGGAYGAAQKEHMIDPFIAKTGINVLFIDYSGGVAEMKAQVESGNIIWDAVDIEAIDLERACSEGLLEVLPFDEFPPGDDGSSVRADFYAVALENECGVGNVFWSIVYAYSTETIQGGSPSTIADFFDTETFPGKRALRKRPQVNLEWALLADGVALDEVYAVLATEEGQARAFAKLDSIRDDLVWYESWSQAPQLLNDGGAVMVQSANGRIFSAVADDGRPFVTVWDGNVYDIDVWSIVKGTPNYDEALEFIKFATATVPLSGMEDVAYGPVRRSAAAMIDPAIQEDLPSAHIDEGIKADGIFWADFGESLGEKFNEWLLN